MDPATATTPRRSVHSWTMLPCGFDWDCPPCISWTEAPSSAQPMATFCLEVHQIGINWQRNKSGSAWIRESRVQASSVQSSPWAMGHGLAKQRRRRSWANWAAGLLGGFVVISTQLVSAFWICTFCDSWAQYFRTGGQRLCKTQTRLPFPRGEIATAVGDTTVLDYAVLNLSPIVHGDG